MTASIAKTATATRHVITFGNSRDKSSSRIPGDTGARAWKRPDRSTACPGCTAARLVQGELAEGEHRGFADSGEGDRTRPRA